MGTSGRGPVRPTIFVLTTPEVTTSTATIGRNASPVSTGEKPSVSCR